MGAVICSSDIHAVHRQWLDWALQTYGDERIATAAAVAAIEAIKSGADQAEAVSAAVAAAAASETARGSDLVTAYAMALVRQAADDSGEIGTAWRKHGAPLPEDVQPMLGGVAYQLVFFYLYLTNRVITAELGPRVGNAIMNALRPAASLGFYRLMAADPKAEPAQEFLTQFGEDLNPVATVFDAVPEATLLTELSRTLVAIHLDGIDDPPLLADGVKVMTKAMERLTPDLIVLIAKPA